MYQPGGAMLGVLVMVALIWPLAWAGDVEVYESLRVVEGVGRDAVADDAHPFDLTRLGSLDLDRLPVVPLHRDGRDHRSRPGEQVGRAVELEPELLVGVRRLPVDMVAVWRRVPLAVMTRPSASSRATEWYIRTTLAVAATCQVSVAGS
jgi:hypothetical protein